MTKFERVAINQQYKAYRKDWAIKQFNLTCELCCLRGRKTDCDKCNIAYTHSLVIASIDDAERRSK